MDALETRRYGKLKVIPKALWGNEPEGSNMRRSAAIFAQIKDLVAKLSVPQCNMRGSQASSNKT